MNKDHEYRIVTNYTLDVYPCGAKVGGRVMLKYDLVVRDFNGEIVSTYESGEVWEVLKGMADEPDTIWLLKPNGKRHTWDGLEFWDSFEVARDDCD